MQKVLHPVPKRTVKAMAAFFLEAAVHGPEASGCCGAFSEGWASWGLTQERRRHRSSKPSRAGVKDCHRSPGARPRAGGFPESRLCLDTGVLRLGGGHVAPVRPPAPTGGDRG